jgi:hypothetical protein
LFGTSKQFFISVDKKSDEREDFIEPVPFSPMTQVSDGSMYESDLEAEAHHVINYLFFLKKKKKITKIK